MAISNLDKSLVELDFDFIIRSTTLSIIIRCIFIKCKLEKRRWRK